MRCIELLPRRDALTTAYPRLRVLVDAENLRLELHAGANSEDQVKAFRIVDRGG